MSSRAGSRRHATPPPLRLVHHHPGRIRVRAEAFRGESPGAMDRVRAALDGLPGVARVTHSPRTGSLLIEYEPGIVEPDAMLACIADAAGLRGVVFDDGARDARSELVDAVVGGARALNGAARAFTGGRADLRELVPAALAATAVYSLLANANGPAVPRWDNALYWSYSLFRDWHRILGDRKGGEAGP